LHGAQALHILLGFLPAETDPRFATPMSLDWTHGELHEGLCCFHSGAIFEAHEHWESVWLAAQEPEKTFLQGLIQVAASFHHFQRGNCAGTISLLRSALRRLDGYPETFAGIAVTPLRAAVRLWLEALETVPQPSPPPLPATPRRKRVTSLSVFFSPARLWRAFESRRGKAREQFQVIEDRATLKP
jgi:predicted metal-dependent hydrolase